jgi:hypothetical protein
MLRRLLNIASIVCLVLCVALMGMWVRSYQTLDDELHGLLSHDQGFLVYSTQGELVLYKGPVNSHGSPITNHWPWVVISGPGGSWFDFENTSQLQTVSNQLGFGSSFSWAASCLHLPDWFLVLASGLLAMAFQLRWPLRFTLRSLFIATTFLAVVLGMIAWLDRAWIVK